MPAGSLQIALGLLAMVVASAGPARAQGLPCAPVEAVTEHLKAQFGETPARIGQAADGAGLVIFENLEAGSSSVVVVRPDGMACLLATGQGWRAVKPRDKGA